MENDMIDKKPDMLDTLKSLIPTFISFYSKGQLISKCPFGIIVWTKIPTKLFLDFCPEMF